MICPDCDGTGERRSWLSDCGIAPCDSCGGSGETEQSETEGNGDA
jgi:hypothetical protein